MLSVRATSQLFVAVAGQKGTSTCPTRQPTRFVLFLEVSFALTLLLA